ncbi:MAG TPA: helix-turn-helix domain-containing protein [Pseudonocardiaceae bacterium]|nr:helix-turn-helix domain-containing protein [Pseudonocardiaceae bacterium]
MAEAPKIANLDARGLRVLAHPARIELVQLLRRHGASTATRLAELMGVNSGTASYHLRQLAAAGFVEEDTTKGNGRDRWWRAVYQQTVLDDLDLVETEVDDAVAYLQSVATNHAMNTQRALNELLTMSKAWRDVFDMSQYPLRLTVEQAGRLRDELQAVVAQYPRDDPEQPGEGERVRVLIYVNPELP